MAKNDKKNDNRGGKNNSKQAPFNKLKTETLHTIWGIVFFVLAVFLFMSLINIPVGKAGRMVYDFLYYLLGYGYILLPSLFVLLGWSFLKAERPNIGWTRTLSAVAFLLSGLGMIGSFLRC